MYYKVLLCTTMWYKIQRNTLHYKVPLCTTKYYSILHPVPATKNHSHGWSSSRMKRPLQCAEQQEPPSTSPNTARASNIDSHDWSCSHMKKNVIYNAPSNSTHPPTPPSTEAATKNDCGPSHINVIYGARSNKSHPPTSPNTARVTKKPFWSSWKKWNVMCNARSNKNARSTSTHPPTSPKSAPATQNYIPKYAETLLKTDEASSTLPGRSEHDPNMNCMVISRPPVRRGYFSHFGEAFWTEKYSTPAI